MKWYKLKKCKHFLGAFSLMLAVTFSVTAQNKNVKGVVNDTDGQPLIGVSVVEVGTVNGTVSDLNGHFTITVSEGAALKFSFIGFETIEMQATADMEVILPESQRMLDEFIVIGYGVQKKSLVSGAISKTTEADLKRTMPTRIEDVLKGQVSGLVSIVNSGQPGEGSTIRIRGTGTVANSSPLYIVDGVQIDGSISYLNPGDIASVEILKDAASAAIYGTRGANGVILITTKTGEKGKARINYDFNYGWQNPWRQVSVLNAQEYMTLMNEMFVQDGNTGSMFTADQIKNAQTTDWQKELLNKNAPIVNHNVNISGGSDKSTYSITFGYLNQEGIVGGNYDRSNLERYTLRINNTNTAFETQTRSFMNKISVNLNMAYTHQKTAGVEPNTEWGNAPYGNAMTMAPYVPVYASAENAENILAQFPHAVVDDEGRVFSLPPVGFQEISNPIAYMHRPENSYGYEDVIVGGAWGEIDIFNGLKFRSSFSIDLSNWGNRGYTFPHYLNSMRDTRIPEDYIDEKGNVIQHHDPRLRMEKERRFYWQTENYFSFDKTFADKHIVNVVLGQGAQKSVREGLNGSLPAVSYDPEFAWMNRDGKHPQSTYMQTLVRTASWGDADGQWGQGAAFRSLASYFGRVNYIYDERYIIAATLRRDGSSYFGANKKWGLFPSVSVAWNILNEEFINNPNWMDAAKLRLSWGRNGNDRIEPLRYASYESRGGAHDYVFDGGWSGGAWNGTYIAGVQPGSLANPDLRWEQSEQTNIGIDLHFLRSAFNFSFDYFYKKTEGMLQRAIIPLYAGQSAPWANVGTMSNQGLEFEIGYKGRTGGFNYFIDANASYLKNKLIEYGNATGIHANIEENGASGVGEYMRGQNGFPYPFFFGLKTDGIFQNWDEINKYTWTDPETGVIQLIQPDARPGDVRFIDTDGNGIINNDDKVMIGKPMPDWTYGITMGFDYKGFDFSMFWQGSYGFDIFQFTTRGDVPLLNRRAWFLDRWHGEGTSDRLPRMANTSNANRNWQSSDLFLSDGSYIRLKTIQLGYTIPVNITRIAAVERLRIFTSVYNLLTLTRYEGADVEIGGRSIDRGVYPQSRTISVGVNVSF